MWTPLRQRCLSVVLIFALALPTIATTKSDEFSEVVQPDSPISLVDLRTEHLQTPLGVDVSQPRFSWMVEENYAATPSRGLAQVGI